MSDNKKFRLLDLVVEEVSLVDDGANPKADVMVFKRGGAVKKDDMKQCPDCGESVPMDAKKCPDCGYEMKAKEEKAKEKEDMAEAQKLQADLDAAKKLAEENAAKLKVAEDKAADLQKKLDAFENTPEAVEKRKLEALPADIKKRLEDAEAKLQKAAEREAETEAIAKVKADFANLPGKAEDIAKLYRKATAAMTDEEKASFDQTLKAANEAIKSNLFSERGRGGSAPQAGSAQAQFDAKVAELRKTNEKLSYAAAALEVAKAHPELYEAVDKSATLVTSVN